MFSKGSYSGTTINIIANIKTIINYIYNDK